jgi:hypothetical protein
MAAANLRAGVGLRAGAVKPKRTRMSALRHFPPSLILLASLGGCAQWVTTKVTEVSKLPSPALPADSVVLEVAFARLPLSDTNTYDEVWQQTDEQAFSTDLRREWGANGLRCGILGSQLPPKLRAILDQNAGSLAEQAEVAQDAQGEAGRGDRRIQCRSGRRAKIYASKTFDSLALLTQEGGTVRGWQLPTAQCLFGLKTYPLGDGRAKIDLVPEVEHGEMRTQYVGREGTVMPQLGRDRVVLDALKLAATLSPGQVLMISTTPEAKGLGQHFFVEQTGTAHVRSLLLVRLAVTQHDDLFAPDQLVTPLATPTE